MIPSELQLNFSQQSIWLLNAILALVMFGIALSLKTSAFREIIIRPKALVIGLISQLILLPLLTVVLIILLKPTAGIAMGMMMIAACPGGNMSNFVSQLGKGDVALSVMLTAVVTLAAVITTPALFGFLLYVLPQSNADNATVNIRFGEMALNIFLLILLPVTIGMIISARFPQFAEKVKKPLRWVSLLCFGAFIFVAFFNNLGAFVACFPTISWLVALHNGLALAIGYLLAKLAKLPENQCRTISIETGIQNAALGLALIFLFFKGWAEMAIIVAWWGLWHLITGLLLAGFWSTRKPQSK